MGFRENVSYTQPFKSNSEGYFCVRIYSKICKYQAIQPTSPLLGQWTPARQENYNNDHSLRLPDGGKGGINADSGSGRAIRASPWETENWNPGEPTSENRPVAEVKVWQWSEIRCRSWSLLSVSYSDILCNKTGGFTGMAGL